MLRWPHFRYIKKGFLRSELYIFLSKYRLIHKKEMFPKILLVVMVAFMLLWLQVQAQAQNLYPDTNGQGSHPGQTSGAWSTISSQAKYIFVAAFVTKYLFR
ncbi:unnamed protein product [Tenebrio molitor]|nr:unnamed protein product [Tenebrio molitor]